jgi:hypothetical protein
LTFELGTGNKENLNKTFSSALTIHILIAVLILILSETVGLWFLENKLVIPAGGWFGWGIWRCGDELCSEGAFGKNVKILKEYFIVK